MSIFSKIFGEKIIYFVRHGESANNASNVRQGSHGGLSEKGKEQAKFVGERLKDAGIQIILSSPYERAKETSGIINEILNADIQYSDLLVERKNPSEIIGKDADDPEVKAIMDLIDKSFHDENFRYSDEENFSDLKKRAKELLEMLGSRPEKKILCVSHRIFIKILVSYMEQGDDLDPHEFAVLDFNTKIQNTAITVCKYSAFLKFKGKNPWEVLAANDYGRIL